MSAVAGLASAMPAGATVTLTSTSASLETSSSGDRCTYTITTARLVTIDGATFETWLTSDGAVADYEAYATILSGSCNGTLNTWLSLSSNRAWGTLDTVTLEVKIRRTSDSTVLATAEITLTRFYTGGGA